MAGLLYAVTIAVPGHRVPDTTEIGGQPTGAGTMASASCFLHVRLQVDAAIVATFTLLPRRRHGQKSHREALQMILEYVEEP